MDNCWISSYGWYEKSLCRSHNYEPVWIELTLTISWSKVLLSTYFGTVISIKATGWVGSGSGYRGIVRREFRTEIDNPLQSLAPWFKSLTTALVYRTQTAPNTYAKLFNNV